MTKDPFKFDKEVYWDRRNKGYHGQVHPQGSKEQQYDNRVMLRRMAEDSKGKKGKNESKKREVISTSI